MSEPTDERWEKANEPLPFTDPDVIEFLYHEPEDDKE